MGMTLDWKGGLTEAEMVLVLFIVIVLMVMKVDVKMTLEWKEGLTEEKNVLESVKFRSDSTVRSRRHLRVS